MSPFPFVTLKENRKRYYVYKVVSLTARLSGNWNYIGMTVSVCLVVHPSGQQTGHPHPSILFILLSIQSILPFLYSSTHLSIHPQVSHMSFLLSIHLFILSVTHLSPVAPSLHSSFQSPICPSLHLPLLHSFHLSSHSLLQPPIKFSSICPLA